MWLELAVEHRYMLGDMSTQFNSHTKSTNKEDEQQALELDSFVAE